jgi:predicted  nucleic acid-binding Zn-ribbon protein|tara:strand:- start:213 stop:635 length:423 start_codon:yes stop_codon:yes gene_type:complete
MKTPQELKKIFDRLPKEKVELEKVELGLIDDVSKFTNALSKANKQIESNKTKLSKNLLSIENLIVDLKVNYNTAEQNKKAINFGIKNAEELGKKIAVAAKELGVKPSEVKGVEELISLVENVEGNQEVIDSFLNMAKKYI